MKKNKISIFASIIRRDILDYIQFDSFILKVLNIISYITVGYGLSLLNPYLALSLIAAAHRRINFYFTDKIIEKLFIYKYFCNPKGELFESVYKIHLAKEKDRYKSTVFRNYGINKGHVLVIKSSDYNEKGVIVFRYTALFRSFMKNFDLDKIDEKYYIVLEPTWVGYFDLNILCFCKYKFPIFIQTYEPRDFMFIKTLKSNLIPVPLGTNCWVDNRIFKPLDGISKNFDLIMVANWAAFKRHYQIFRTLNKIKKYRKYGRRLNMILIGYSQLGRTKDDVYKEAKYYNVEKQLELIENISQEEVNYYFNCSKVGILWSRKEGGNQSIIEGMFSGVPFIVRKGHNYGFKYDYINKYTGIYSSEQELPNKMLYMVDYYQKFSPNPWVTEHMSCQRSTAILNDMIKKVAVNKGENWTKDICIKVDTPGFSYWDKKDNEVYNKDYEFLKTNVKTI